MKIAEHFGRFFNRKSEQRPKDEMSTDDIDGLTAYLVSHVLRHAKSRSGSAITGGSNMTELGLDSLAMFSLTEELGGRLGVSIPPELVFEVATLRELAEAVHSIRLREQVQHS